MNVVPTWLWRGALIISFEVKTFEPLDIFHVQTCSFGLVLPDHSRLPSLTEFGNVSHWGCSKGNMQTNEEIST